MEYLSTIIFAEVCEKKRGVKVPEDFLVLASSAIHHLSEKGRSNIILYSLAKGIGTVREDGSDSCTKNAHGISGVHGQFLRCR